MTSVVINYITYHLCPGTTDMIIYDIDEGHENYDPHLPNFTTNKWGPNGTIMTRRCCHDTWSYWKEKDAVDTCQALRQIVGPPPWEISK